MDEERTCCRDRKDSSAVQRSDMFSGCINIKLIVINLIDIPSYDDESLSS